MYQKIIIFLILNLSISFKLFAADVNTGGDKQYCKHSIKVGSGRKDGRYYEFVDLWSKFEIKRQGGICIENIASQGSVENIDLLERQQIDFAIIQGDIGHHVFYGRNGFPRTNSFSGLKPLYKEFVQIVTKANSKNSIKSISSLNGKTIAAGNVGSGGYWNALDLLSAAGLYEGYNFQFFASSEHPVSSLQNGKADAAIYTSAKIHKLIYENPQDFSFIELPESASKKLSIGYKKFYYDHGYFSIRKNDNTKVNTVSVSSYLIVSDSISTALAADVKQSVDGFISYIKTSHSPLNELHFIEQETQDPPFTMHFLSTNQSQVQGIFEMLRFLFRYWLFIMGSIIALLVIYSRLFYHHRKYNSIGLIQEDSFWHKVKIFGFEFSKYAIGIAIWFMSMILISLVIVAQEERFSASRGFDSPLQGFGVIDGVLWLIKTAFTNLPGEVPLSPISSILIPITVILGLGAFLHPVKVGYSAAERRKSLKANGNGNFSGLRNHVLICGWNERTEGVIFSLISQYTPKIREVVVIADLGGDEPLKKRRLDSRRVHYVRGNAFDTETLHRASAGLATEAIIMASENNKSERNITSILTAVALSNLPNSDGSPANRNLFICAELIYQENESAFVNAGVHSFVHAEHITNKVAAASAISEGVSDFITDFLTFDDHFEIYLEKASLLSKKLLTIAQDTTDNNPPNSLQTKERSDLPTRKEGKQDTSIKKPEIHKLRRAMTASGFQLLGKSKESDSNFAIELCNSLDVNTLISKEDWIIFFSDEKSSIKTDHWKTGSYRDISLPKLKTERHQKILLIGDSMRLSSVSEIIKASGATCLTATRKGILDHINGINSCAYINRLKEFTKVVVLEDLENHQSYDKKQSETTTALICKYLSNIRQQKSLNLKISSEICNQADRALYKAVGVDDVLVRNSLIERLLTKMVFNQGRMYDIVEKLITLDNGIFLETYSVNKGSKFEGMDIREAITGRSDEYQICGWLPQRMTDYLSRNTMSIDKHWITALNSTFLKKQIQKDPKIYAGDQLMIVRILQ